MLLPDGIAQGQQAFNLDMFGLATNEAPTSQ